jgi:hypothetical protein
LNSFVQWDTRSKGFTMDKYEKSREMLKACWEGYKMIGTKEKGGKTVPNCVPKKKAEELLDKTEELLELIKDEKKYSKKVTNPETGREKTVKYGAKGYTIAPGTSRGDSYCARSAGQMKDHPAAAKDPNSPLRLSRKKWKCSGSKSTKKSEEDVIEVDPSEYLAKAQELLGDLRKATSTRWGHITFPQLGINPEGRLGVPRDPQFKEKQRANVPVGPLQEDPQKHFYPAIPSVKGSVPFVPREKLLGPVTRLMVDPSGPQKKQQMMAEAQRAIPAISPPTTTGTTGARLYLRGKGKNRENESGFVTAPTLPSTATPEEKAARSKSIMATQAHEDVHGIGGQLSKLHRDYRGPIFDHLGEHILEPLNRAYANPRLSIDERRKMLPVIAMAQALLVKAKQPTPPPHVSPYEEFFAYMQNYASDPTKRKTYESYVKPVLGRDMTEDERRYAFAELGKMYKAAQAEAATITPSKADQIVRKRFAKFKPAP